MSIHLGIRVCMKTYRSGFYSVFFLLLLVSVGIFLGLIYEYGSRSSKNREYYYHQLNLYDEGVSKIAKACLQKYSLQECQTLTFTLGNYEISLILIPQDSQSLLLDSVVQTQDLLSGQILRKVSRRVLLLP